MSALKITAVLLRCLLWLSTLCIALVLLIPIAFLLFFDPNTYKPEITAFIKNKTGLSVAIQGPIQLTYLPHMGVTARDVALRSLPLSVEMKAVQFELPLQSFIQQAKQIFTSKKALLFVPEKVIVEGTTAYYEDKATQQQLTLKAQDLKITPTSTQAAFKGDFSFVLQEKKVLLLQGKAQLTGNILFSDLSLQGHLSSERLLAKQVVLTKVKAHFQKNKRGFSLAPITADFYGGVLQATFKQNKIQGHIDRFQLQPLLYDLHKENRLRATANVQFSLIPLPQRLDGTVQFRLQDGTISGIDVPYYFAKANALLKKQSTSRSNTKQTAFSTLTGTLKVQNHVVHNPDLLLLSPELKVNGAGSIHLAQQNISYKLQAWPQYQDNQPHPNTYPLAIRIKGALSHPHIEPDIDLYFKMALRREAEKQINKQIHRYLGTPEEEAPQNKEEKLKKKIEEKLQKSLKKIFK